MGNCDARFHLCAAMTAVLLGGCQSPGEGLDAPAPAALSSMDEETIATLRAVLADAMNDASITLGPGDLTKTSTIAVLPPRPSPYEGRSTAKPVLFDIFLRGDACFVVRRDSGAEYVLRAIACRKLDD